MTEPRGCCVSPVLPTTATALLLLHLLLVTSTAGSVSEVPLSLTPPRGWNSYDSFSWIISEQEFLQNAEYVAANLLKYGYEYVVVDFLWYRKQEPGASVTSPGHDIVDEWGRLVPDPARWPSTVSGKGFKPIADKVHAMGLKFGIHVMRGISTAAVAKNTRILCTKDCPDGFEGRNWTAKDITVPGGQCSWMWDCFVSVNTDNAGGQAFINSLYDQYAEWGVDMIKHDCVFGRNDLNVPEITTVGKAMERTGRSILYSLSPGVSATPELAKQVAHLSHMYRITSDDWDSWSDVLSHFPVARDFAAAGLIGAPGLRGGKSWPDMDMLPIGWLTDAGAAYGPLRNTSLTKDEQLTQITLWAIVKSPLMFGGDLRNIDQWTSNLITQPIVLEMNAHSTHNRELSSSVLTSMPDIVLEDCGTATFHYWKLKSAENGQDELCWYRDSQPEYTKRRRQESSTDCLSWSDLTPPSIFDRSPSLTSQGIKRGQLRGTTSESVCLDSASRLSDETNRNAVFSLCDDRPSQVWQLINGSLVNENGLCAIVQESPNQWKVWVARGSEGQSYVAFFNLGSEKIEISVAVEDILNHISFVDLANPIDSVEQSLPSLRSISRLSHISLKSAKIISKVRHWAKHLRRVHKRLLLWKYRWSCAGLDVWNNTHFITTGTEFTASVESHGTVLYELRCASSKRSQFFSRAFWYFVVLFILFIGLLAYRCLTTRRLRFNYRHLTTTEDGTVMEEIQEETTGTPTDTQTRTDGFSDS